MLVFPVLIRSGDPRLIVTVPGVKRPIARPRNGGKPAARKLKKPVKRCSKRAQFLNWFLLKPRTVDDTMAHFGMTRANVFAYWTMINRDHGIGYAFSEKTITAVLPAKCDCEIFD